MLEFFEDKGDWSGYPVIVQGIFEDGECIAVKVLDRTDNAPISWTFPPLDDPGAGQNGKQPDLNRRFMNILQRLYDEKGERET